MDTLGFSSRASSIAHVNPLVKISIGSSGTQRATAVAVLPESRNTVVFGRSSAVAFSAMICFSDALRAVRLPNWSSVPTTTSTDLTPPFTRTTLRA